ncbi:hypothetical protein [Sinomicrobium weinanense]|uniref:DUF2624 family protein n=1 Tax=Sinomicrobium weinanense TaxID=2842200 RepID=A0A926JUQ1_9FLAO|nr:hypothetical protein [Sinomicrobium weinanense]MBC9797577.1 hypothetical protein [Sinomicrobium weinanense]MBU3123644.1 hypothetical protein [Sinomicrobium weinanense]
MKRMSPEKVVSILSSYGEDITLEEAETLLDFLYELASIALRQSLFKRKEAQGN